MARERQEVCGGGNGNAGSNSGLSRRASSARSDGVGAQRPVGWRGSCVVTLADIEAVSNGSIPADRIAKTLRERGWLEPLSARGVWMPARWRYCKTIGFEELLARLRTHPSTPAAIAGRSVLECAEWLKRPTALAVGMPPGELVPRSPAALSCCTGGAPAHLLTPSRGFRCGHRRSSSHIWRPGRPGSGSETQASGCPGWPRAVDLDALRGEMAGRPRSVWMKAAFVLWRGGCEEAAAAIARAAPPAGAGPYKFGVRSPRWGGRTHPEFDVVDYIFVRHWHDPAEHFIQWDGHRPPATDHRPPTTGHRPPTTGHRPPTTGHRPPTTDHRPPATDHRPPATGHRPPATGHRPPATDHRPPATDHRPPATGHWPPTTDHRPPTTGHRPPATGHRPPATDHRPPTTDN